MSLVKVMTGHGKRRAGVVREQSRMTPLSHYLLELNWLSCELNPVKISIIPRYQDEINYFIEIFLRNILEAQRQRKWQDKCYLYAIIYSQQMVGRCWLAVSPWPVGDLTKHPPLSGGNQLRNIFGSSASKQMIRQMLSLCHHLPTNPQLLVMFSTSISSSLHSSQWLDCSLVSSLYFTRFD